MAALADLLRDYRVAHGGPADLAEAWAEEEGRPLGGDVGEEVARVLARGPVAVADALGALFDTLAEEARRDAAGEGADPDGKGKGSRAPKVPELVALAKAYLEIRDRALAELAIKPG